VLFHQLQQSKELSTPTPFFARVTTPWWTRWLRSSGAERFRAGPVGHWPTMGAKSRSRGTRRLATRFGSCARITLGAHGGRLLPAIR